MAKKITFENHTPEDLRKYVEEKREELRRLRFSVAGSKNADVKLARTLRREIARTLTELTSRGKVALRQAQVSSTQRVSDSKR